MAASKTFSRNSHDISDAGDDSVNCYIAPNFIEMPELQVKVFFQRLNDFLSDPEMAKKRVERYRSEKEKLA